MVEQYRTVYQGGGGEFTEKKSRFLGQAAHVETEEEAQAFIERLKKQYWDASHNCWAYVLGTRGEMMRCSDDGEPQGTAGRPMLDVLTGRQMCNTVVVVTRYFGGTLLGTGGLVRAYSRGAQCALDASVLVDKYLARKLKMTVEYTELGKVQYLLAQEGIQTLDTEYGANVWIAAPVPVGQTEALKKKLTEGTNGRIAIEEQEEVYSGLVGGKVLLFES